MARRTRLNFQQQEPCGAVLTRCLLAASQMNMVYAHWWILCGMHNCTGTCVIHHNCTGTCTHTPKDVHTAAGALWTFTASTPTTTHCCYLPPHTIGTWFFGRNGWCDGQQVSPWVADVTDALSPGSVAQIQYKGLYYGQNPPAAEQPGIIMMQSMLVLYGDQHEDDLVV